MYNIFLQKSDKNKWRKFVRDHTIINHVAHYMSFRSSELNSDFMMESEYIGFF